MPKQRARPRPQEHISFPKKFWIFAADFSLKCPGFCKFYVEWDPEHPETVAKITRAACTSVDMKKDKLKSHGELLDGIFYAMGEFKPHRSPTINYVDPVFYVREHAFNSRGAMSEMGIFEVVGVANFWAYQHGNCTWHEIYPVTVKKTITGDARAQKSQVAQAVKTYFPDLTFANDDESDAAAVGLSWLIQNGMKLKESEQTDGEKQN